MDIEQLKDKKLWITAIAGAGLGIVTYKLLNEGETSLLRRLERARNKGNILGFGKKKPVRIWIEGCWDLMHFGHANAFRQARALGDYLIVGLNGDEEIIKNKGPPIMTEEERLVAVKACKWVDEVVQGVPYIMDANYLKYIFEKYKVDFVVHGDDPCLTPDGRDVYEQAKATGRFQTIKRTEGVSSTDIVGRMLLMTKDHFLPDPRRRRKTSNADQWAVEGDMSGEGAFVRASFFLPTARRIGQFSSRKVPKPTDKIVYIDGAWDMFHAAHIEILQEAKKMGDFLIVGVHPDHVVNEVRGSNYPILNLHERVLSVMSCQYVDEVVFGAPWKLTQDMLTSLNIHVVCRGNKSENVLEGTVDPYELATSKGICHVIKSKRSLTTPDIVSRIISRKNEFQTKFDKKHQKEQEYLKNKEHVAEI